MINYVYQLVSPGNFMVKHQEINCAQNLLIKPLYMSICHADQRYYLGQRSSKKLKEKLPMALIHEAMGEIVFDPTKTYSIGQKVIMIPNVPSNSVSDVIYENYQKGSAFRSSGIDGFMREIVDLPVDRVVPFENINFDVAAICEFISVGVHAVSRFKRSAHSIRKRLGIWGDGSLGYVMACILKHMFPECHISIVGKDLYKLSQFVFADEIYLADSIPEGFNVDHAFECAGGTGSYYAIDDIIRYINPQGNVMLLGVTEDKVAINTRDILEKGLTLVGSSRSGREDFEAAVKLLELPRFQSKIKRIIYQDEAVNCIEDIHKVLKNDLNTPFKTVFKWNL